MDPEQQLHLNSRNRESPSTGDVQAFQAWHVAPMGWRVGHEKLIEGTKPAGQTRRKTYEPKELPLVATELADGREKIVQIEALLRYETFIS